VWPGRPIVNPTDPGDTSSDPVEGSVPVPSRTRYKPLMGLPVGLALAVVVSGAIGLVAQSRREFSVSAKKYSFTVSGSDRAELRVTQDDLVRITFAAEDIPHSFTFLGNNPYRIDRRAEPGKSVTFDFRADTPGTFDIGCSLSIDPRCQREMRAKVVVEAK
jgi:heme/copper-type cytochrome/quinol oxidase subunit 2